MDQAQPSTEPVPTEAPLVCLPQDAYEKKNFYPYVRHTLLATAVLFSLVVIIFLIYQNGKSIYDNGL